MAEACTHCSSVGRLHDLPAPRSARGCRLGAGGVSCPQSCPPSTTPPGAARSIRGGGAGAVRAMGWCGTELLAAGLGDGAPLFFLLLFLLLVLLPGCWRPLELRRAPGRVGYLPGLGPSRGLSARRSRRPGALPPPYPNGWYRVLDSAQLPRGAVRSLALLGECGIPAGPRGRRGPGCRVGCGRPRRIHGVSLPEHPRPRMGTSALGVFAGVRAHPNPQPCRLSRTSLPPPGTSTGTAPPRRWHCLGTLTGTPDHPGWELHWGIRTFLPRLRGIPARASLCGHRDILTMGLGILPGHPAPMLILCLGSLPVCRASLSEHPCWGTPKPLHGVSAALHIGTSPHGFPPGASQPACHVGE